MTEEMQSGVALDYKLTVPLWGSTQTIEAVSKDGQKLSTLVRVSYEIGAVSDEMMDKIDQEFNKFYQTILELF